MILIKKNNIVVADAIDLTKELKTIWDKTYLGAFVDYRRVCDGKLPQTMENIYNGRDYKRRSKLKPRLIADILKDLVAYTSHTLFAKGDAFEFIPFEKNDVDGAEWANKLVSYSWLRTKVKLAAKSIIRDAGKLGGGFGRIEQYTDWRFRPRVVKDGVEQFDENNMPVSDNQILYRGGRLVRICPETVYPENISCFENIGACPVVMSVPLSKIQAEAQNERGLYYNYRHNVKKIKRFDFQNPEQEYNQDTEHDDNHYRLKDYPVQVAEIWQRMRYGKDDVATWYCITIANYGSGTPLVIRFARDPMGTGTHPFIMCRIFPRDDRMYGDSIAEMLMDLFLEKFHKKNQRIDFVNYMIAVHGTIFGKTNQIATDNLIFKMGKFIQLRSGQPKDLHTVTLPTEAIVATIQEEGMIDKEAAEAMASNKITSGKDPARREAATTNAIIDENAKIRQTEPISNIEETLVKPVANAYLLQCQLYMPASMRIRILGEKGYEWQDARRKDILGRYDVICRASTEILPRALKQANMNAMIQTYVPVLGQSLDLFEIFKVHAELNEIPNAHKWIKDTSHIEADIKREEDFMVATGQPWIALKHEPHIQHLNSHADLINQLYTENPDNPAIEALENHITQHQKLLSIQQGQTQVGGQPRADNMGDYLNNTSAEIAPKAAGR